MPITRTLFDLRTLNVHLYLPQTLGFGFTCSHFGISPRRFTLNPISFVRLSGHYRIIVRIRASLCILRFSLRSIRCEYLSCKASALRLLSEPLRKALRLTDILGTTSHLSVGRIRPRCSALVRSILISFDIVQIYGHQF